MHSWQNGTRCRDGVNVLWCRSHLVWLVFEGSIPTCTCSFGKPLCDLFLLLCFLEVIREKRGRQGKYAWSVGYKTWNCVVHKEQRYIINLNASK